MEQNCECCEHLTYREKDGVGTVEITPYCKILEEYLEDTEQTGCEEFEYQGYSF